ncbi:MAG: hypothetical protein WD872_00900 [Pirellulaceae bacterium]
MKSFVLTLAATAAIIAGSMIYPDMADARPRGRGYNRGGGNYARYYSNNYRPRSYSYSRSYRSPSYYGGYRSYSSRPYSYGNYYSRPYSYGNYYGSPYSYGGYRGWGGTSYRGGTGIYFRF